MNVATRITSRGLPTKFLWEKTLNLTNEDSKTGMVFRKSLGKYYLKADNGIIECSISSTLRKHLIYPVADPSSLPRRVVEVVDIKQVDPLAIGDKVSYIDAGENAGMITDILPRKNKFSRRATGPEPLEQVIVANIDQIVAVIAVRNPKLRWDMLDRFIAGSEALEIPMLICITKMDLSNDESRIEKFNYYEAMGYPVIFTCAKDATGMDEFAEALKGKVSVLVGESAVGKSTLLNAIQPGLELRVNEVGKGKKGGGKGKHTTSSLEMFDFEFGGSVVDTPGMQEFGLWNKHELNLAYLYRDMRPYLGQCKYASDCAHIHEPECAIKNAVEAGNIAESRYKSYMRLAQ